MRLPILENVDVLLMAFRESPNFPVQPTETRGAIDLKTEEAGLRRGGRGKSEIFPALQKCSDKQYTKKPYPKLRFKDSQDRMRPFQHSFVDVLTIKQELIVS